MARDKLDYIEVSHPTNPKLKRVFWKTEQRADGKRHFKVFHHTKVKYA